MLFVAVCVSSCGAPFHPDPEFAVDVQNPCDVPIMFEVATPGVRTTLEVDARSTAFAGLFSLFEDGRLVVLARELGWSSDVDPPALGESVVFRLPVQQCP